MERLMVIRIFFLLMALCSFSLSASQPELRMKKRFSVGAMAIPNYAWFVTSYSLTPKFSLGLGYRGSSSFRHESQEFYAKNYKESVTYHSGFVSVSYFPLEFPVYLTANLGTESTRQWSEYTLNVDNKILYEKYSILRSPNYFLGLGPGFKWLFEQGFFIGGEVTYSFDSKLPLKTHVDVLYRTERETSLLDYLYRKSTLDKGHDYLGRTGVGRIDFMFYVGLAF
jgi:hypothetical protein